MYQRNACNRRKYASLLIVSLLMFVGACSGEKEKPSEGLIHIDVLEAFDDQRSMKLSNFIKDVEFIPLESTKESYFRLAYDYTVGKKYVMVADGERAQLVLFTRKGEFIRTIGIKGKGPGELNEPRRATMDPQEENIYVFDGSVDKLLKFSVEGDFINEVSVKETSPARYIEGIKFINDDQFVLVNRRPYAPMDGFVSLPVFNKNLEIVKNILPRGNDENLRNNVSPHALFAINPDGMTFWEPFMDTLFNITPKGKAIPTHVIGFSKGGPTREFITTNINPNTSSENSISSIVDDGQYFHIRGKKGRERFTVLYNHKTEEIFEVFGASPCDKSGSLSFECLENDLYGVGTLPIGRYTKGIDRFVTWATMEWVSEYYDLECIRKKEVKYPELRDRFLEIAEDPDAAYQKIIVLMKLK